ncbi:contact-dependent growth inhibition system immunity protein [Streptomyces sp. NPDC015127]|uniref:contact-dependent growth inhibition system immunity protein n=1 Tax=Streptomyces sp. NPDC015127 TaxID=3364939 RepID=UPI0036F82CDD
MSHLLHLDRTLEELEDFRWPPPGDTTYLVTKVHALRRRPLGTLTPEDLRTLIAQSVGLPFLLPIAMEVLRQDPLTDARFYEGDLLEVVLSTDAGVWALFPDLAGELRGVVQQLTGLPGHLRREADGFLERTAVL